MQKQNTKVIFSRYLLHWRARHLFSLMLTIITCLLNASCTSRKIKSFDPALIASIEAGDAQKLETLLAQGADPNMTDSTGQPAITLVTKAPVALMEFGELRSGGSQQVVKYRHHAQVVILLVQYGANVNVKNVEGWTPLMQAKAAEETELVTFLIKAGATH